MRLSIQEQNLVSIYHSGTRMDTIRQLREVLSCMDAHDAQTAHALIGKLERMSDSTFALEDSL